MLVRVRISQSEAKGICGWPTKHFSLDLFSLYFSFSEMVWVSLQHGTFRGQYGSYGIPSNTFQSEYKAEIAADFRIET